MVPKRKQHLFAMRQVPHKHRPTPNTTTETPNQINATTLAEKPSSVNSFTLWGKIGQHPIKILIDSGSTGNNISVEEYNKLAMHGTFSPASRFTSDIMTAGGNTLKCKGTFKTDVWLGERTVAKDCTLSVIAGLALDKIVIGVKTITHLQKRQGWLLTKHFHKYPECPNFGKDYFNSNCHDECQDATNHLCVNPFHEGYEILPFVDDDATWLAVMQASNTNTLPVLEKVEQPREERIVATGYTVIQPESVATIPIKFQTETWNETTNDLEFQHTDLDKIDLRIAEPALGIAHLLHMNPQEDAKILSPYNKCMVLVNRSNDPVEIHKNNVIGKLFTLQVGKRVREIELQQLQQFKKDGIQDVIDQQAPVLSLIHI